MDLGSIFLGLALALLVAVVLIRPFFEHSAFSVSEQDRELSAYQAERDRILNRLQELDMDFSMGKVLEADYETERRALMQEGAGVLRQIDQLQHAPGAGGDELSLDDRIEAEVANARASSPAGAGFCPSCGSPIQAGDLFCTRCGQALQGEEASA